MNHIGIDIETRSSADIGKTGLYRYALDPDFSILLFAYKTPDSDVKVVDLAQGEKIPDEVIRILQDPGWIKHAYNAAFEWFCLNTAGLNTPLSQWQCTMIQSMYCGYPASLDASGKALGLPQDKRKLSAGKALIRYFCVPCRPTKANGGRHWNLPKHDPDKWELFKTYNGQDVVTEQEILARLQSFPVPDSEWEQWRLDVMMNAYGVRVDTKLVDGALSIDSVSTDKLTQSAIEITGLENPNLSLIHISEPTRH